MTDEKYLFFQDTKEKKIVARSARHARTHNGKRGAVKFPSDYLTKGQIKKMSGECKSYNMNAPMGWEVFKEMPDDLKIEYITSLREKFGVPDKYVADMMGVNKVTLGKYLRCLGIGMGSAGNAKKWNIEGFYDWINGVVLKSDEEVIEVNESLSDKEDRVDTPVEKVTDASIRKSVVPSNGRLVFEGNNIDDVLNSIRVLLNGANVYAEFTWEVK